LAPGAEAGSASEKKSLHATEGDTEANRKRREEFIAKVCTVAPEHLIFLDESGVTTSMTRLYGRSLGGKRIHESTPGGHWKIMTILGAMSLRGMIATMTIEEATDADIFLAYVEHVLCPALKQGDVVVMDNQQFSQGQRRVRMDRKSGSEGALSATLFPRPQPDREGLVQAQTTAPLRQGSHQRDPRTCHR